MRRESFPELIIQEACNGTSPDVNYTNPFLLGGLSRTNSRFLHHVLSPDLLRHTDYPFRIIMLAFIFVTVTSSASVSDVIWAFRNKTSISVMYIIHSLPFTRGSNNSASLLIISKPYFESWYEDTRQLPPLYCSSKQRTCRLPNMWS